MRILVARVMALVMGVASVLTVSIAGAPASFAASNGQHLNVHDGPTTLSVVIGGHNQYNQYTATYINTPGPWTKQTWWWKYTIKLRSYSGYGAGGAFLGYRSPYVPVSYGGNYWKVYAY